MTESDRIDASNTIQGCVAKKVRQVRLGRENKVQVIFSSVLHRTFVVADRGEEMLLFPNSMCGEVESMSIIPDLVRLHAIIV